MTHGGISYRTEMTAGKKVLLIALTLMIFISFAFPYVYALDRSEGQEIRFTGIQMLFGGTGGKSAGMPHPMLLLTAMLSLLLIGWLFAGGKSTFLPIACAVVALAGLLMFRFDVYYTDKREFDFVQQSAKPGVGWWLACAAAFFAAAAGIVNKAQISAALRHKQRARIYENRDLPAGYRDPSEWLIIRKDFKKRWPIYLMMLPIVTYYIVWAYGPMYGLVIAFNDYVPKKGFFGSDWVGLYWYREYFRSAFAWRTIRNTFFISGLNLLIGFPAPILLALMLNEMRSVAFKRVVQTVTYIPHFISMVVMAGLLIDFLASDGVITTVLNRVFGLEQVNYLGAAKYFRTVYVASDIWQHLGWNSIIYLSALSGIDQELYEAARIDGAGRMQQTWHVTLPGIAPTITILLILRMGSLLSVGFEKIILLYNALTLETADVISSYVFRVGIEDASFSRSTAIGTMNSIVNFLLVILANKVSSTVSETSLW